MRSSAKQTAKATFSDNDSEELSEMEDQMTETEDEDDHFQDGGDDDKVNSDDLGEDGEEGSDEDDEEGEENEDDEEGSDEEGEENEDDDEGSDEEGEENEDDDGQNEIQRDAEMEELEKEYMDLRNQEQDIWKNLKQHQDDDLMKGQAVMNQKTLWDKTLEFRFLLQKAYFSSNKLPQDPIKSSFCSMDEQVNSAYSDLITSSVKTLDSLLELEEALLEKNPTTKQSTDGNSGQNGMKKQLESSKMDAEGDEEWLRISQMNKRLAQFRDKSVDKWQRKTQVTTGAAAIKGKLHAFNQNISEQVASYMRDPSRIIKQMQQRRSTIGVLGPVPEGMANNIEEEAQPDGDPELLDDTEFYQQLLREFFESVDPTSSETAFSALKKLKTKKRKIVDRRASKSRKIRYNVHEKIVNFMAPKPMPSTTSNLFENLFGLKTQKTVSEV